MSFFGLIESGQAVEAIVRNFGDADVGLARIGVSLGGEMGFGENSKQRCLAYLGQSNYSRFHKWSWLIFVVFLHRRMRTNGKRARRASTNLSD